MTCISNVTNCLNNVLYSYFFFFPDPGFNPRSCSAFTCHVPLVSFNLEPFLSQVTAVDPALLQVLGKDATKVWGILSTPCWMSGYHAIFSLVCQICHLLLLTLFERQSAQLGRECWEQRCLQEPRPILMQSSSLPTLHLGKPDGS